MKKAGIKRINPVAKQLADASLRSKVVASKTVYSRKGKNKQLPSEPK